MKRSMAFFTFACLFMIISHGIMAQQSGKQIRTRQKSDQVRQKGVVGKNLRKDLILGGWNATLKASWGECAFKLYLDNSADPLSGYIVGDSEPCHLTDVTRSGNSFRGIVNPQKCKLSLINLQDKSLPVDLSDSERDVMTGTVANNIIVGEYESEGTTYKWDAKRMAISLPTLASGDYETQAKNKEVRTVTMSQNVTSKDKDFTTSIIKKKNGELVKGDIIGIILQGKSGPVSTDSRTGYGGLYYAGKGEDIRTIDEEGVHYKPGAKVGYVSIGQNGPINDAEAARVAVEDDFIAMFEYSKNNGMASVNFGSEFSVTSAKLPVLGEYRIAAGRKTGRIIPTIDVRTAKGIVSISIEEIVTFRVATEKPKQ